MTSKQKLYRRCMIGLLLIISGSLYYKIYRIDYKIDFNKTVGSRSQQYEAQIQEKQYRFILENNNLYEIGEDVTRRKEAHKNLFMSQVLDIKFYNLDHTGNDELIVLSLGENQQGKRLFGEELRIYTLTEEKGMPKATLKYSNNMASIHPWMIEAGQLDRKDAYGNIFVGVYKDTRYYKEIINRPFFFKWNGEFMERKWTGSYLSPREFSDLIFLDFDGDGCDEIATLEKTNEGTYKVTLYKWLTFGFEYLMTSKESYKDAISLKSTQEGKGAPTIWVQYKEGCEAVAFK